MAAFQKVYEQYATAVYRFLLALTGQEDAAEELLQETFYQALQHIDRFEGRCSLYTWLCQIGKNAWYKECKRKKRFRELDEEPNSAICLETELIEREQARLIRRAMQKLEEPYRSVFIMHALGGAKLKEIAQMYDKSESWARVTYFRAKQQILQEVSK